MRNFKSHSGWFTRLGNAPPSRRLSEGIRSGIVYYMIGVTHTLSQETLFPQRIGPQALSLCLEALHFHSFWMSWLLLGSTTRTNVPRILGSIGIESKHQSLFMKLGLDVP